MRRHPEIGESIIKPIRSLQHLCDPIRHHHEKIDGSGYPDGLKGEEISPLVRILAVADAYDALTTERSYRPKKSKQQAIAILRSMKNHLDQDIVNILLEGLDVVKAVLASWQAAGSPFFWPNSRLASLNSCLNPHF